MPSPGRSHLDGHAQGSHTNEQDANSQTPLLKRPLPKPATILSRMNLLFQNWWLWEIVSATIAVLAIIVIIVVIVIFDQSPLPDWPSVLTVRSVYILHVTILLKACLDKFNHLLLWRNSETFYYLGGWSLNLAIEMVMVSPR